jgi:hypothetical protein
VAIAIAASVSPRASSAPLAYVPEESASQKSPVSKPASSECYFTSAAGRLCAFAILASLPLRFSWAIADRRPAASAVSLLRT